jgi:carnitine 3-dehydrogenase
VEENMYLGLNEIKTVTVVGTGTIGACWAARFINRGINVIATDLKEEQKERLMTVIENAERSMNKMLKIKEEKKGTLEFTTDFEYAVKNADFIQEAVPDYVDLKISVIERISKYAKPNCIIASSTSNIKPTIFAVKAVNPDRVVVGHPFNPVYITPIVEIVGGEKSSNEALDTASKFYEMIGMKPIRLKKEVDGFLGNRLQEAMWREILFMVRDGVASPKDVDDATIYAFGLRLSFMGTCLSYTLGGGEGGMEYLLEQFGPTIKDPLSYLIGPDLTPELSKTMIDGSKELLEGRSIQEMERLRDDCMVDIIKALSKHDYAAGKVLNNDMKVQKERGLID